MDDALIRTNIEFRGRDYHFRSACKKCPNSFEHDCIKALQKICTEFIHFLITPLKMFKIISYLAILVSDNVRRV